MATLTRQQDRGAALQPTTVAVRVPGLFSSDECDRIISTISKLSSEAGTVWDVDAQRFILEPTKRRVTTWYFEVGPATTWIYNRLDEAFKKARPLLGCPAVAVREPCKLMRYRAGDHFNIWHTDAGPGYAASRVLSLTVELSDRSQRVGGDFQFLQAGRTYRFSAERGDAIAFRSTAPHRVTPVESGERFSIVNWAADATVGGQGHTQALDRTGPRELVQTV